MTDSTSAGKPEKPHKDFPLYSHNSKRWAKKIRGKTHFFGPWDDPQGALERWLREKDYLLAGKKPPQHDPDALTIKRLCDLFMESRQRRVTSGEMAQRTFDDYHQVVKLVADHFGRLTPVEHLTPADFGAFRAALSTGVNLKTLEGRIACIRAVFNYADKNGFIERSLSKIWGTEFAKPSRTALTKLSNQTERLFSAAEIRKLVYAAKPQLKAMILLGANGGIGPTDLAMVRYGDIKDGWLTLARNKTGKPRRVPLWPETLAAIDDARPSRPKPKAEADADLVFITKYGGSWLPSSKQSPLSSEFAKLRKSVGIVGRGKTFYTLRHTLQTIGDETRDFVAVASIMGHSPQSISDQYRERIGDDRLQAVADHVYAWLFPRPTVLIEGGAK